ncbi:MAG: STAS domain-containing protein [Actinomycetota bacterium]|nr:STAS domain-containing protein [Actinomycetota bacterium]
MVVYRGEETIDRQGEPLHLKIHCSTKDRRTVLTPLGDLDMAGAPSLRQAVIREVGEGHNTLVIDLSAVTFIDSSGLGVIVGALRRTRSHDGELVLVCPNPELRRAFELCDLDRIFELHADLEAATSKQGSMPG